MRLFYVVPSRLELEQTVPKTVVLTITPRDNRNRVAKLKLFCYKAKFRVVFLLLFGNDEVIVLFTLLYQ